ncbi:class I ribonucleotide reductase maintenance protein YfaE [Agaribacter marinus]|uniref:class I ribonucleotide reductase maintenance protein YfaE n=1 Tax=Agaribacter marinus TaxID=1431249 RepID=UPI0024E11721|nr:class I ribonucleotide reductase maintenance protein YfaE [Agaribacter marinus]
MNKDARFTFEGEDNLLIAMEKQNIDVHYHCREGFCGACRTKICKGKVEYVIDPLAFIDDDEVLVCCCIPVGDVELQTY